MCVVTFIGVDKHCTVNGFFTDADSQPCRRQQGRRRRPSGQVPPKHPRAVPLYAGELLPATRGYHPHRARRIRRQRRRRSNRASLKVATAVRASPVLEAVHAVWAPSAFERADVSLIRGGDVAVATFAIWANLKHATTLSRFLDGTERLDHLGKPVPACSNAVAVWDATGRLTARPHII